MSVRVRHVKKDVWQVDVIYRLPNGRRTRERRRVHLSAKSAAKRWGERREQHGHTAGRRLPDDEVVRQCGQRRAHDVRPHRSRIERAGKPFGQRAGQLARAAWSSASRSTIVSSATTPAAAITPA